MKKVWDVLHLYKVNCNGNTVCVCQEVMTELLLLRVWYFGWQVLWSYVHLHNQWSCLTNSLLWSKISIQQDATCISVVIHRDSYVNHTKCEFYWERISSIRNLIHKIPTYRILCPIGRRHVCTLVCVCSSRDSIMQVFITRLEWWAQVCKVCADSRTVLLTRLKDKSQTQMPKLSNRQVRLRNKVLQY